MSEDDFFDQALLRSFFKLAQQAPDYYTDAQRFEKGADRAALAATVVTEVRRRVIAERRVVALEAVGIQVDGAKDLRRPPPDVPISTPGERQG
jgi:hypothetical protein